MLLQLLQSWLLTEWTSGRLCCQHPTREMSLPQPRRTCKKAAQEVRPALSFLLLTEMSGRRNAGEPYRRGGGEPLTWAGGEGCCLLPSQAVPSCPRAPLQGFATAASAAVESVCLSTSYPGLGSDVNFPSSVLLFPKQPLSVAGRWCRSSVIHNCFGWLKNPGYCSPWHPSLRGLEHQTSLSPTLTPEPSASREVPNQEGQS